MSLSTAVNFQYSDRRKTKRNKKNVRNQNSLWYASRRTSTERRKTKKNLFLCFYADWPSPRINYTERRKTKLTKTVGKNSCLKKSWWAQKKSLAWAEGQPFKQNGYNPLGFFLSCGGSILYTKRDVKPSTFIMCMVEQITQEEQQADVRAFFF